MKFADTCDFTHVAIESENNTILKPAVRRADTERRATFRLFACRDDLIGLSLLKAITYCLEVDWSANFGACYTSPQGAARRDAIEIATASDASSGNSMARGYDRQRV